MTACPHCREIQEERAAIHQYDGGATREQADTLAATERCSEHRVETVATAPPLPLVTAGYLCKFLCNGCKVETIFDFDKSDPTTADGKCRDCGSDKWIIFGPDGNRMV